MHDLTNRKSLLNLEVLEGEPESGIRNVPILHVGTKQNEVLFHVEKSMDGLNEWLKVFNFTI